MVYTQTWNAAYEADPSDSGTYVSVGADRIRDTRTDIRERIAKDHYFDIAGTDADHGEHSKITFNAPLGADPSNVANKGFIYTKDVSGKVELFWEDEDGNVLQLTYLGAAKAFPTGTVMAFGQSSAPTGWTRLTTGDTIYDSGTDNAMFCFSKSGSIGQGGAFNPQAVHNHTAPSHTHDIDYTTTYTQGGVNDRLGLGQVGSVNSLGENITTDAGGAISTGSNQAPYYVELILAKKD